MIKEKFLNLVNVCKNDRDMLDIIESDMRALGEYVYAVHMMETSLPIIRINYEGQELRDRVEKLDHNRREHHERAIMGVKRLNRLRKWRVLKKSLPEMLTTDTRLLTFAGILQSKCLMTEQAAAFRLFILSKLLTTNRKENKIKAERESKKYVKQYQICFRKQK